MEVYSNSVTDWISVQILFFVPTDAWAAFNSIFVTARIFFVSFCVGLNNTPFFTTTTSLAVKLAFVGGL